MSLRAIGRLFAPPSPLSVCIAVIALLSLSSATGRTQSPGDQDAIDSQLDEVPAHIAVVDGAVTLERDGKADAALENMPLLAGDRLRTDRGRAEVLFADGSAIDVDESSAIDLQSDSLTRLLAGRVRLLITRANRQIEYRIDTAAGAVRILSAGEYRVTLSSAAADAPSVNLAVIRGNAELSNDAGRTTVYAGTYAIAGPAGPPSIPYTFNSASWDAFDRWTESLRDARLGVQSSRYLPPDLQTYGGTFDSYGYWGYEQSYGYVWFPRVSVGWRPYYDGRWTYVGAFGWTWVGVERFAWPTHHFGRWQLTGSRWFWVPDRRWSPAWVSWQYSPNYVSWCPLGFDGRPAIAFSNGYYSQPWAGWTVVTTQSFTPNFYVRNHVVSEYARLQLARNQFVERSVGPPLRSTPSTAQPIRSPGNGKTYAVPRGTPASPNQSVIGTRQSVGTRQPTAPAVENRIVEQPRTFDQGRTNPNRDRPTAPAPGFPATPQWTNPQTVPPTQGGRQRPPDAAPAEPPQFHYGQRAVPRGEEPNTSNNSSGGNAEPAWRAKQPEPRGSQQVQEPPPQYEPRRAPDRFGSSTPPPSPPPQATPRHDPPPQAGPRSGGEGSSGGARTAPPASSTQGESRQQATPRRGGGGGR